MDFKKYAYSDKRGERSDILPRLNRSALAREMGISRSQLSRILLGNITPPLKTLEKLAQALGAGLDETVEFLRKQKTKQTERKRP